MRRSRWNVINTAIESTARLRKKQFEGEQQAREFQRKHVRSAAEARDAQSLMAAGQGAAQEAMERSMHYWSEMFDLIVEIQKRLFTLIEEQMEGVPGVKETKAAMAMLPGPEPDEEGRIGDAGRRVVGWIDVRVDAARDGRFCEDRARLDAGRAALITGARIIGT